MPDTFGRLTLEEMRQQVRRKLDLLRYKVNADGSEGVLQQLDVLISNEDLNMYLNMALARRCIDVNIADNTIMADEALINIVANTVEYQLPDDMMFLRAVYITPVGVTALQSPPSQRYMLFEDDTDNDINTQPTGQITTYRRRLNYIVLNQVPQQSSNIALSVDYVKMMLPLLDDAQILETPLSWMIQQVIMQDAAVEATVEKLKLDASELRTTQGELVAQLQMAVLNYHAPKVLQMTTGVRLAYPPWQTRPNSWQNGWGWRGNGWF